MSENRIHLEKALLIVDLLDAAGITSEQVAGFEPHHWDQAADAARVKRPSPGCRARVIEMLRNREAAHELLRRKPAATETHTRPHIAQCRHRSTEQVWQ